MTATQQSPPSAAAPKPGAATSSRRQILLRRPGWLPLGALVAALAAGTAYEVTSGPGNTGPARITATAPFGTILVDGQGKALYQFAPDGANSVTCTGACARKWRP